MKAVDKTTKVGKYIWTGTEWKWQDPDSSDNEDPEMEKDETTTTESDRYKYDLDLDDFGPLGGMIEHVAEDRIEIEIELQQLQWKKRQPTDNNICTILIFKFGLILE